MTHICAKREKKTGGCSRLKEVGLEKQVSVDRKSYNHFARDFIPKRDSNLVKMKTSKK